MQAPEAVELLTGPQADKGPSGSVIWLHGLGADGYDFEPVVAELDLPERLSLRFVFPHAPIRPVTINGGMQMRAWYDIFSLERGGPVDEAGILDSSSILEQLIEREVERGVASERIVLAGFSQGGAIAVHTALHSTRKLAGLMVLSTYVPMPEALKNELGRDSSTVDRSLPIFIAHGSFDPMLPIELGRNAAELLREQGFDPEWHDYPMAHAVCPEEIGDIRNWLLRVYGDE